MGDPQTISINGRDYDAITGRPLKTPGNETKPKHHPVKTATRPGKVVDGFFRSKPDISKVRDKATHKVAPHISRATEHSKTLMRSVVKNPSVIKIKTQQQLAKRHINHMVSRGMVASAPARASVIERANAIKKSELVEKFSELATPANPITPDPKAIQTSANSEVHLKKLDHLSKIESNPDSDDIFTAAALNIADPANFSKTKKEPFYERMANKVGLSVRNFAIVSLILFILVVGGLSYYLFSANISMYIADKETGIHGVLPTYEVPGFSLKSIAYTKTSSSAEITLTYKSNSDSRSYHLQEESSDWDNQALLTSVVQPAVGNSYNSYLVGGRTVYIYGPNAVWIGTNVYYSMTNSAGLTTNQISEIVGSI